MRTSTAICALLLVICASNVEAKSARAQSPSRIINNQHNVTVNGGTYSNPSGDCFEVNNSSHIVVENVDFENCWGVGFSVYNSTDVWLINSKGAHFNGGVFALISSGIHIINPNLSDPHRDWQDPARGQLIQFDQVTGAGNEIRGVRGGNVAGSDPEDQISLYKSYGTEASPITLSDINLISPTGASTSGSGSGVILGDGGGAYQKIEDYLLINPGQVGIGVAGGEHITVGPGIIWGQQDVETNVGLYVWNQSSVACGDITVQNNVVSMIDKNGNSSPNWDGGGCGTVAGWDQNVWGADLSALDQ